MNASKRRPASTQAVSRKVEGIEPRNQYNREDDAFNLAEVNTGTAGEGNGCARSLGVGDHGMRDCKTTRQPGRPCRCFPKPETRRQTEKTKLNLNTGRNLPTRPSPPYSLFDPENRNSQAWHDATVFSDIARFVSVVLRRVQRRESSFKRSKVVPGLRFAILDDIDYVGSNSGW
jgi:hypothetical protein